MTLKKILKGMPEFIAMREGKKHLENNQQPLYLMMNLETSCPLRCKKCALPGRNRKMGKPLSLDERKSVLDVAASINIKELVIIGAGEPSAFNNFVSLTRPVIQSAFQKGFGTIMFTTSLGINEEQAVFYRDHDVTVFISLDSLNQETYRKLTGTGNLAKTLENIRVLRAVYEDTPELLPGGRKLIRLAINVTIQKDNVDELDQIKKFAGSDMLFIANAPMPEGKLRIYRSWIELVGDGNLESFKRLAAEKSETGSHSSVAEGICSYFNRGISIDSDGQFLACGYASESAHCLGNARDGVTSLSLVSYYQKLRKKYTAWCAQIGRKPSCPLRDDDYEGYIRTLKR